uniref:Midasin n=1 Tax=Anopheles dirus TaxID=7168 RepID=A0A182NI10_9DIPT
MEIECDKVLHHVRVLQEKIQCKELDPFSRLRKLNSLQMDDICTALGELLENERYTEEIGRRFRSLLLLIVTNVFEKEETTNGVTAPSNAVADTQKYQRKCIALSKLILLCPDVLRYSMHFFRKNPSPFARTTVDSEYKPQQKQRKQQQQTKQTNELELIQACYRYLMADSVYFRSAWNWSEFFEQFDGKDCPRKRYYLNRIMSNVAGMSQTELNALDNGIPVEMVLEEDERMNAHLVSNHVEEQPSNEAPFEACKIIWQYKSNIVTNVGDVLLPIFDQDNVRHYQQVAKQQEKSQSDAPQISESDLVASVNSTKLNLRNLALGVSSGKAICLSGPVGSGKTSLVEYLAKATGRIAPRGAERRKRSVLKEDPSKKRKLSNSSKDNEMDVDESFEYDVETLRKGALKSGFLRVQLGDQTDSKTLLGQYRCTDTPGEFVWQPGVLTQAVMYGYWLLLEDLDSATQDVCTVLTNLLENGYLSVPGFRDCLRVMPGFQLFVTLRSGAKSNPSQVHSSTYSLLEKYLYTVTIVPLSRKELSDIICIRYPKLRSVASRIVDIYLTFSSGCHSDEDDANYTADQLALLEQPQLDVDEVTAAVEDTLPRFRTTGSEKQATMSFLSGPNRRLVSTRDLIKLCRRSDPSFSATSVECAYFVFQNAVDLFCSHIPHGPGRTKLVTGIGGKIGVLPSRCDHLCEEYKPAVEVGVSSEIRVGRVVLKRSLPAEANENNENNGVLTDQLEHDFLNKRQKLDRNASSRVKTMQHRAGYDEPAPTFSFTRPAACLLERIAVAVSQNEPILLVGETGVGKTSSVQYLAYQTHHKLVVVNMNNQSDVSDLVGGYKPVDLGFVVTPLRYEFERLFRRSFNAQKNEKFLANVARCYGSGEYDVLVKLMLKIAEKASLKKGGQDLNQKPNMEEESVRENWNVLQGKLRKLDGQLKNSINVSFAFIPGSLVNCIRNGDWVLLDEINLASTETLECLSTILEPDGSIVLLERGDYTPVKRHPNFRIFACMNPSTDVGKKDLPVGIRNRFTEFFVDELLAETDLLILVNDYLSSTGILKARITNTVKLYRRLRAMAQLELNDGLGNRPVFSLRTLCRALSICGKNLCGSIERNLFEAFCISFLTQLDLKSHATVLSYIRQTLLPKDSTGVVVKALAPIPRPKQNTEKQLDFEGYWIEQGPREVQECSSYILTDSVRNNLRDLARIISIGRLPVLLQGPTSAGKTSLIEYIAKRSGNVCLRINNHEHTDLQEYIGTYVADVTGKLTFREGVLVEAMRNGHWIILDELNLAPSDILEALNRVLDDNRELFIPETQVVVKAHPNFMLFATQNPPGLYGGRKMLSRAFKNRFIELHFSDIPKAELEVILERRCHIPRSYAVKMVKVMSDLQLNRRSTTSKQNFTLRDLFRWGNRYTYADKVLLEDHSYDWNQHLIDEGYLVLSSKVRYAIETEIIREALFTHFRKRVEEQCLFSLSARTSKATRSILERVMACRAGSRTESVGEETRRGTGGIVWTFDMRRMAVLTAKALQFNEPVLLVGPTGCGKTTICQLLATLEHRTLRILNCHMHTEGADFLGGLRPYRTDQSDAPLNDDEQNTPHKKHQLFEWSDGPLILSMQEGGFFLADEISLAEDSVLERLNCVLEPERTLLLAEKGGLSTYTITDGEMQANTDDNEGFVITAREGFQFLATMNPGGDFGKKELSPALRNRLTEIWCRATDSEEDLIRIAENTLRREVASLESAPSFPVGEMEPIARVIIREVCLLKRSIEKLNFSIRDVLAWVGFVAKNAPLVGLPEALIYGLETVFLDSLEMLPYETYDEIVTIRRQMRRALMSLMKEQLKWDGKINLVDYDQQQQQSVGNSVITSTVSRFGIHPFYIELEPGAPQTKRRGTEFMFTAPTTQRNLFRLMSALSLDKAILLEGPPGVGKTSLVESLAREIGYDIVRINLCEHTDLADLFGTDLPADDRSLEVSGGEHQEQSGGERPTLGSFVWRDGPLLAALKARRNTWILLDELNLAPQSVLEGLNAILDHRGEVYIAELNKTFHLGKRTRIFAAQNPLRQGGGRKGLPQSFLNRFTKVYLRKLERRDLLHVVEGKYKTRFDTLGEQLMKGEAESVTMPKASSASYFEHRNEKHQMGLKFDLAERMVLFSERLESGLANLEFGYKGGPFEANLRDILRWCELFFSESCGYVVSLQQLLPRETIRHHLLVVLFEKMKLVYYQRMRAELDKRYIVTAFSEIFQCDGDEMERISQDIGLYWTDDKLYLGDIVLQKNVTQEYEGALDAMKQQPSAGAGSNVTLVLASQLELLKSVTECVQLEKPVILCGPSDCGKTKVIALHSTLADAFCQVDTIDDSVTGSFQQFDFNRHLEEMASLVEGTLRQKVKKLLLRYGSTGSSKGGAVLALLECWEKYDKLSEGAVAFTANITSSLQTGEMILFRKRLSALQNVIIVLRQQCATNSVAVGRLNGMSKVLEKLEYLSKQVQTLNTGGHFEWVDSKVVKCLRTGQHICLEHVNLCSSAVLDRLNPVFEPNGTLMISEKGSVKTNDTGDDETAAEVVQRHRNFQAFLTLDPKNGEISRAMRNRCVELAFASRDVYAEDDLRRLVFASGVHEPYLIEACLSIHKELRSSSGQSEQFSPFGVAHLVRFAQLTAQNLQKQGAGRSTDCLKLSAMDVYVRSSNVDLLGYGLDFYRNALKETIEKVIEAVAMRRSAVRFENVTLRASGLTKLARVKLQAEPFLALLRGFTEGLDGSRVLADISTEFQPIASKIDKGFLKYLLYFLYEISTGEDVSMRATYLRRSIGEAFGVKKEQEKVQAIPNGSSIQVDITGMDEDIDQEKIKRSWDAAPGSLKLPERPEVSRKMKLEPNEDVVKSSQDIDKDAEVTKLLALVVELNEVLAGIVQQNTAGAGDLPWNRNMFPRIRDYLANNSVLDPRKVSKELLLNTILSPVQIDSVTKLSQIDLLSYSKAVRDKVINDGIGNGLLLMLYEFLTKYRMMVVKALKELPMSDELYVRLIISNQWLNRLIALSHRKLYENKEVKVGLLDNLTLHFQWVEKHCLSLLEKESQTSAENSVREVLRQSITELTHPLLTIRKAYGKQFLEYLPLYSADQVEQFVKITKLVDELKLVPKLGKRHTYEEFRRRVIRLHHPKMVDMKRSLLAIMFKRRNHAAIDESVKDSNMTELNAIESSKVESLRSYQKLITARSGVSDDALPDQQLSEVIDAIASFEKDVKSLPRKELISTASKYELERQPLLEYYVYKLLIASRARTQHHHIRMDFVQNVRSLGIDALSAIKLQTEDEHHITVQAFNALLELIAEEPSEKGLSIVPSQLYRSLSTYWHQFCSTLERLELSSVSVQRGVCYNIENEDIYEAHQHSHDPDATDKITSSFRGALLTMNCLAIVLGKGSSRFRVTGLGELPDWRHTLGTISTVLWSNSRVVSGDYQAESNYLQLATATASKLLKELDHILKENNDETHQFVSDFLAIANLLRTTYQGQNVKDDRDHNWQTASLMRTLTGTLELNMYVFLPLLDPVEKNRLKKRYIEEDIELLETLVRTYDCMSVTMNYRRLGDHNRRLFLGEIERLKAKGERLVRKVALRPGDDNLYAELVRDVNNFLLSCCHPATIGTLIKSVIQCLEYSVDMHNPVNNRNHTQAFLLKVSELLHQIDLWNDIALQFEHHTLKRYDPYYRDFMAPLCNSIATLRYGLNGLRHCLCARKVTIEQKPSGAYYDLNEARSLRKMLVKFVQFPCAKPLELFDDRHKVNIYSVMEKLPQPEHSYFRLLKARLQEVYNRITVERILGERSFAELDRIVNVCNQVWQKQEHLRRKRQAEEDSLYLTKSHCEEESEDVVAQREINEMFPNYVDEDFAEFIQNDTLEQIIKTPERKDKHTTDTIGDEDYALICESFIMLMAKHTRSYYYHPDVNAAGETQDPASMDFVKPFETKLEIFAQIAHKYEPTVGSEFDEIAYGALSLAVGLLQERYDDQMEVGKIERKTKGGSLLATNYNFYTDANIPEVLQCVKALKMVDARVRELLQEWPDHAVLNDILLIMQRIQGLPSTAPIVRFSTGLQLLRQKLDEWNSVAHRGNNMRELEREVVEYIHRWMRMELQYWRECLSRTLERVRSKAYRYWFFMYNLLHEYLQVGATRKGKLSHLLDYNKVEKCYGEQEILDEEEMAEEVEESGVTIEDVIKVLKQFMESSNFAEYGLRLRVMKSFEQYLHYLDEEQFGCDRAKRDTLIAALYNIHMYFAQFSDEIEEHIRTKRVPIEKKLKEFVKIESFNKDLSYFSMRNNIARVHRQLHKFLKEFEEVIAARVAPIFCPKDPAREINDADEQKVKVLRSEAKVTYYMVDVKSFMAPRKLMERFSVDKAIKANEVEGTMNTSGASSQQGAAQLFQKIDRFFSTARNVCREAILHAPFPGLVYGLDTFMHEQIETIEYLRGLEVDRTQPRPKQKSQAKQILNQKRKTLSDFYKTLAVLGLSYRSGLVESAIGGADPVDPTIKPFSLKLLTHASKYRKVDQHIVFLNDKLNLYYAKCVFKIKLLSKVMLQPDADIAGPINVDRIKGFSIDMFLVVQNQRKSLSEMVDSVFQLRELIANLYQLNGCLEEEQSCDDDGLRFSEYRQRVKVVRQCALDARLVLEQFQLLLASAPNQANEELQLLESSAISATGGCFHRDSVEFGRLAQLSQEALKQTVDLNEDLGKTINDAYYMRERTVHLEQKLAAIREKLEALKNVFKFVDSVEESYSVYGQSVVELLQRFERYQKDGSEVPSSGENDLMDVSFDDESVNNEIENIIHSLLLAMQTIYKKYSEIEPESDSKEVEKKNQDTGANANDGEEDDESSYNLQEQHLKQKINADLLCDLKTLNIAKVVGKLHGLLSQLEPENRDRVTLRTLIVKLTRLVPILEQYNLLVEYYLIQQLGAHKICTKMLSVMLTVFIELATKGFCVPKDLLGEEAQEQNGDQQNDGDQGEKFGFEDGEGEKDASHKIESEDQLDDARKPGTEKEKQDEEKDNKEEKGIDMSEDFDSKLQDMERPEGSDSEEEKDEDEEMDKQMGETEEGAEKLDDQIWGDDDEKPEEEENDNSMEEEEGAGSNEKDERHNDLDSEKDKQQAGDENQQEDGMDAIDQAPSTDDKKKQRPKDINDMDENEGQEEVEQENPYHNELEEPPEPEDLDLNNEMNLDEGEKQKDEEIQEQENPFDIDAMKENAEGEQDGDEDEEKKDEEGDKVDNPANDNGADSSDEEEEPTDPDGADKLADEQPEPEEDPNKENADQQVPGEEQKKDEETVQEEEEQPKDEQQAKRPDEDEHHESHDKRTEEDRVEAMPDAENKGTSDQVANDKPDAKQENEIDEQDTGEDKEGTGQAENEQSDKGHRGIAESKKTRTRKDEQKDRPEQQKQQQRKQGHTDEDRSLGNPDQAEKKRLKTVEQLNREERPDSEEQQEEDENEEERKEDEFQHVKDAKCDDKTTMDNATEEQSKQVQHQEKKDDEEDKGGKEEEEENADQLMEDEEEPPQEELDERELLESEKNESKKDKPAKKDEQALKEKMETEMNVEVEGEIVPTATVARGDDTVAHTLFEILHDVTLPDELTTTEQLDMRKLVESEMQTSILQDGTGDHEAFEQWQHISHKMLPSARDLCEQLRLILEPTKCTRLKGDYRTGRRINMKKIIPYIASQFRKDKIWLRRTKPAQRDYKITIAIDDSKSMDHNNSKDLTLQAISLVSQALTLLESGRLNVMSFGEKPRILLKHSDQFDGPKLISALNFAQNQSRIAELLKFVRTFSSEDASSSENGVFEHLMLVLSDGRNIYSEGEKEVKNAVKLARLQRIFIVYIVIDNPDNKHSIMDVRVPLFTADSSQIVMQSYLDVFPFPYYVIVRDLGQLPMVLSDAMRQWFELVNSEQ